MVIRSSISPLRIGELEIPFPFVLAGMAGYTDLAYRLICRSLGAPFCTTEVMLDRNVLVGGKLRRRLVRTCDEDHPVAAQIMGNDPDGMSTSARVLCEAGFDVIDLNFACPVRKVLARKRGGNFMRQPEQAGQVIRAVLAVADRPVTIKLRRAFWESVDDDGFWRIAESAFDAGVASVCLHGRSVEAKYTGPADWEFIAAVKRRFGDKTIIGSGDVFTPADALRMLRETGVDGVSVARGALGNPWFFSQIRDILAGRPPRTPSIAEQRDLLERHFAHACQLYGTARGPRFMRKFGIKYSRLHPTPAKVRAAFVAVQRSEHWHDVMEEYYSQPG